MSRIKNASHSILVQNFHEFFNLLLRQKEFALRANEGKSPQALASQKPEPKTEEAYPESTENPETPATEAAPTIPAEWGIENPDEIPSTTPSEQTTEEATAPEEPETKEEPQQPETPSMPSDTQNNIVTTIQRRLSLLLEEQAVQSTVQAGEFAVSTYQESLYAMVAFADEMFLNIPWSGQKYWEDNLLESRFFQTQIAGELIFKKIENLVSINDPMHSDLAIIYLLILGLGFKGKFRSQDENPKRLRLYRQQLYSMINRHPSNLFDPGRDHLIEACYDHTLDSTISTGLPEIRMWLYTFVGILAVYLFASTLLWYTVVRDMDSQIANILKQAQQMGIT